MVKKARHQLTVSNYFLQPANSTHRQYEALRAYFVDKLLSAEAGGDSATRRGASACWRTSFDKPPRGRSSSRRRETRPNRKQNRLREKVVMLRKQNPSVYDISPGHFPRRGTHQPGGGGGDSPRGRLRPTSATRRRRTAGEPATHDCRCGGRTNWTSPLACSAHALVDCSCSCHGWCPANWI